MKLSIIIPVYRTEATLNRCIESVVGQDFSDFEVILVDDGSPDLCPMMCDKWQLKDSRIRVIHKSNGGLSDARNAGIDVARGEFLTFVDSDDYIGAHTYLPLMQRIEEQPCIDILEYPVSVFHGSPKQYSLSFQDEEEYYDAADYWLRGCAYRHAYAWNKIYRRSLFDTVRFPVGVIFEDVHTLPRLLKIATVIATSNEGRYYYCMNKHGITQTADGKALRMLLEPHADIIRNHQELYGDSHFAAYYIHALNIQMDVYELTGESPILPQIQINVKHLKDKQKIKAIALNTLGIKMLCRMNKFIHRIWKSP